MSRRLRPLPGESLLIQALSQAGDSIELLDERLRLMWVNDAFVRLHGRSREEVIGRTPAELALGAPRLRALHQKAGETARAGSSWTGEVVAVRPDGTEVPVELTVSSLRDDGGALRGFVAIKRDRTEAVQARRAAERREKELEGLLNRIPVGIVMYADGVVRYVNQALASLVGCEVVGAAISEIFSESDVASLLARQEGNGRLEPIEVRLVPRAGGTVPVEVHAIGHIEFRGERCFCDMVIDQTVERERREATVTADRLQTIGQIAAGVAHEVNNPLAWMIAALEELDPDVDRPAEERRQLLAEALEGAHRIRHVVRELVRFTRDDEDESAVSELGEVARAAAHLAQRAVEARSTLVMTPAEEALWVRGSAPKLGQVMLNLLLNAAAAMPEGRNGNVEVRWNVSRDGAFVEVSDDGVGMSQEVQRRAFEPFFTTRAGRGGTGLGLAISHNIVVGIGGTITIESELGRGTRVRVTLPRAEPPVTTPAAASRSAAPLRVLVVDDERLVGKSLCRRIRQMGHACREVESASRALGCLRESEFDIILCDLMMPDMDGRAFHAALHEESPALAERVIFMTGGAFTPEAQAFLSDLDRPWLIKPFNEDALEAALRHESASSE